MVNDLNVQVGVETTFGTVASTFIALPVEEFDPEYTEEVDYPEEARGDGEDAHQALPSVQLQKLKLGGRVYHDCFDPILRAAFGAPVITTNPNFRSLAYSGKLTQSLSVRWTDSVQGRQCTGAVVDKLELTFGGKNAFTWSAEMVALPETDITLPAPAFSASVPFQHWQAAVLLGGAANADLMSYKLTYLRGRKPLYTAGSRAPRRFDYARRGGKLELMLDFPTQAEYTQAKALAARSLSVTFTDTNAPLAAGIFPQYQIVVAKAVWASKAVQLGGTAPALKLSSDKLLSSNGNSVTMTLNTL